VKKLPLLISAPHGGLAIPPEVSSLCRLSPAEIAADGDEGAAEIYALREAVTDYVTTPIARAFVDMNRSPRDRRQDGVVKTHTCWEAPVYREVLPDETVVTLLERYYYPYHEALSRAGEEVKLGVDCHTMAAVGPPVGPDPGQPRPAICLSNADGTCPAEWMDRLVSCFEEAFERPVSVNTPFRGGYIIRAHARERPWVQVELSRECFLSHVQKHEKILQSITSFCQIF